MDRRLVSLVSCLLCIQICYAYHMYQERIPNGAIVPNPCKEDTLWSGVGHQNHRGGGLRNPFGEDFENNGAVWNEYICTIDSDGDGKTNGEELGDPKCIWFVGQEPSVTVGLSHPGICEPMTDEIKCGSVPNWVNCEENEFICPALSEPETFSYLLRIPETPVPAKLTTYSCTFFEFPTDQEYHLVADTPYLDNVNVIHHIGVYGCTSDISNDIPLYSPRECDMDVGHPDCTEHVSGWSVGLTGKCAPDSAGILIGGNNGYKYAAIQIHWTNPELRSGLTDSSGMNFFLTPKLRMYNLGVLDFGQLYIEIPPNEESTKVTGVCSQKCLSKYMEGPINITHVFHHMHTMGKSQFTELRRNGEKEETLAEDEEYDYYTPIHYRLEKEIVARPGDEFLTTCEYRSTSRTKTTYFGESTSDEMCLSYVKYYPKENMRVGGVISCSRYESIDTCELDSGVIQGCKIQNVIIDPRAESVRNIGEKCAISHCRKECKEYIRVLKSIDPCYQGDVYKGRKRNILKDIYNNGADLSLEELQFYSRADSCDLEIALDKMIEDMDKKTGGANGVVTSVLACFVGLFFNLVLYNLAG